MELIKFREERKFAEIESRRLKDTLECPNEEKAVYSVRRGEKTLLQIKYGEFI